MEQASSEANGFLKDAIGNVQYVQEMLSQVEERFGKMDAVDNEELCQHIMASAGLRNAIETLERGVSDFINEAVQKLEGGGA
ncbi:hypothetical protein DSCA_60130 [Desulfosarcina alkanivorans]|uniref:Uncharacterized protein n=1 Tax=Desulfosarcina alkanivorans TaxID=571177 RepID=A0A5K7YVQ1_9BACT|nr:hypothetical protein [Desulfosarcina alkanivorans]BBO72083.1 hypothetical protein DSCA_60130 [Desulfosarcina alkanivorans]